MTVHPTFVFRDHEEHWQPGPVTPDVSLLGAVRDDIRQTLRTGWIEPGIEAAAAHPAFLTTAWSAIRPNVGKSFLALARRMRTEAVEAVRGAFVVADLRARLDGDLSDEERRRVDESVRAGHLSCAKAEIVVHALGRAIHRDRIAGTGREEPPIRRGVPDWQRWMSLQPGQAEAADILQASAGRLGLPSAPTPLRLLARWPSALSVAWDELGPFVRTQRWMAGTLRLRRLLMTGIATLPHPIDLQWTALKARGFSEDERQDLARVLDAYDAAMPAQTLLAAFLWVAFGAPEIGVES